MHYKSGNKEDYKKALSYVEGLNLSRNQRYRGGCPSCGGLNTFSAYNDKGVLRWHCFKLRCRIKGTSVKESTIFDAKDFLLAKDTEVKQPLLLQDCAGWQGNIKAYPKAWKYIESNNCTAAYEAHPEKFYYDAPNERLVFVEHDTLNSFKLATGRSLNNTQPKWYKYVALPGVYYIIANSPADTVYVVEDCASACSLSRIGKALALCGTSYNLHALTQALTREGAKKIVVCLDNDAKITALRLRADLNAVGDFESVKVKFLKDDAKYLQLDYLKKELDATDSADAR